MAFSHGTTAGLNNQTVNSGEGDKGGCTDGAGVLNILSCVGLSSGTMERDFGCGGHPDGRVAVSCDA